MAELICKQCGGIIEITAGATWAKCPYCGTQQKIDDVDADDPSHTDDIEDQKREERYQDASGGYDATLSVLSEEEILDTHMLDYYISEFTALGDYKDSAQKAEECRKKLKEIQVRLQKDAEEAPPESEEPTLGNRREALKLQIAELAEIIKKDEEAVADIKNKLSKIDAQDPEKVLRTQKKIKVAIPIVAILGIICFIVGAVLIGIGRIVPGIMSEFFALIFLISSLVLWYTQKKSGDDPTGGALAEKNALSAALAEANKTAEEHRGELQNKQEELDRYLLGL